MKLTPANTSTPNATTMVRRAVRSGVVVFTAHARARQKQRGINDVDVFTALTTGNVVGDRTEPENWLVIGEVTVAIALYDDPRAVVVTVMH